MMLVPVSRASGANRTRDHPFVRRRVQALHCSTACGCDVSYSALPHGGQQAVDTRQAFVDASQQQSSGHLRTGASKLGPVRVSLAFLVHAEPRKRGELLSPGEPNHSPYDFPNRGLCASRPDPTPAIHQVFFRRREHLTSRSSSPNDGVEVSPHVYRGLRACLRRSAAPRERGAWKNTNKGTAESPTQTPKTQQFETPCHRGSARTWTHQLATRPSSTPALNASEELGIPDFCAKSCKVIAACSTPFEVVHGLTEGSVLA